MACFGELSHRTVETHRTHVMFKMGAANLAEPITLSSHWKP